MRRTIMASLVLALTLGMASVSTAQQGHGERAGRDGRGAATYLLKGIDLTDAQKEQLKALHQTQGARADKSEFAKKRDEAKAARERGDTAAVRALRSQFQAEMKQRHEAMLTSIRGILTPAQREIFEKNLVEGRDRMKDHMKGHMDGKPGKRDDHDKAHGEHKSR